MIQDWIWSSNVRAFAEIISRLVGDDFSVEDWGSLQRGLLASDTDASPPRWHNFTLRTEDGLQQQVLIGQDQGTEVVQVQFEVAEPLEKIARFAISLLKSYNIDSRK